MSRATTVTQPDAAVPERGAERAGRRAVWVVDSLRMGGAERLALAAALEPPPGWRIELIALQPGAGELEARARAALGARLTVLGMRRLADRSEYRRLLDRLRAVRPELIHAHLRHATLWTAAAGRALGVPWVGTRHVLPAAGGSAPERLRARLEAWALQRAERRVYVSEAQRRAWGREGGSARARVVANGVEQAPAWTAEQKRAWRAGQGFDAARPLLLTVAVARAAKGWREWLASAEQVSKRHPEAQWAWVGGGGDFAALAAAHGASPVREAVRLAGARGDVADWLRGADLFVFPSHGEALPTAVIEAMAQRLPVIATDLAACHEVLGECGRYVPVGSGAELARAVEEWLEHPEAARAAAEAAETRWRERYSPEAWRANLAELYEEAAPRRRRRLLMVEFFGRGGLDHYCRQLAAGLAAAGGKEWEITLLTGRHAEPGTGAAAGEPPVRRRAELWTWDPHAPPRRVPRRLLRAWRGVRYVAAWEQVLARVRREPWDVILLGDFEHRCDAWYVRRLRRRGVVLADIWHNVEAFERVRVRGVVRQARWRDRLARELDVIFVHGAALARDFGSRTGQRARIIAHGNQEWIARQAGPDPDLDRRLELPRRRPLALLFGTLSAYKGVEVLLGALAQMAPGARPLTLIAGMPTAGVRVDAWQAEAAARGLEPWLRWDLRYVPTAEIAWYFRRADFVVLPYRAASQSGVAHLALTFGKPLVVTAVGSLAELIDGNGCVVAAGDEGGLAAAIEQLSRDPLLREQMGRRSADIAATRHNWISIGHEVLETLEDACGGADGASPTVSIGNPPHRDATAAPPQNAPAFSPKR